MKMEKTKLKTLLNYWINGAEKNYKTAKFLYDGKKFSDCLFFSHLTLEKILKASFVKLNKIHAPYVHELDILAKKAKVDLSDEQMKQLRIISTFNIAARYDNIKYSFYKKCTKEYTTKHFDISKKLYLCLKKQLKE